MDSVLRGYFYITVSTTNVTDDLKLSAASTVKVTSGRCTYAISSLFCVNTIPVIYVPWSLFLHVLYRLFSFFTNIILLFLLFSGTQIFWVSEAIFVASSPCLFLLSFAIKFSGFQSFRLHFSCLCSLCFLFLSPLSQQSQHQITHKYLYPRQVIHEERERKGPEY